MRIGVYIIVIMLGIMEEENEASKLITCEIAFTCKYKVQDHYPKIDC